MEFRHYTISKSEDGWIVSACGRAVLGCKQKRAALTAVMWAKQLMGHDVQGLELRGSIADAAVAELCGPRDK